MSPAAHVVSGLVVLALGLLPGSALAQTPPVSTAPAQTSRWWIVGGGGATTLRGDCETCSGTVYRSTGSLLVDIGFRANDRVDGGVELAWVPASTQQGEDIRTTFLMGVGQFRPWRQHGFFVKGGMGVAFVRNWVYDATNDVTPPYITNAMALTYGAGWAFLRDRRVGFEVLGTHNVLALGDLTINGGTVENVVGNFWTVGGALVIR